MFEQMAVVLHHQAAAAGSDDDGFATLLQKRPPRIDVAFDGNHGGILCIEVVVNGATATSVVGLYQLYAEAVEHAPPLSH